MISHPTVLPRFSPVIAMPREHSSNAQGSAQDHPFTRTRLQRSRIAVSMQRAVSAIILCSVLAACSSPGNFAPELAAIEDQTSVTGREVVTLKALGTDRDNNVLTYEALSPLPDGLKLANPHTGWISGTPTKAGTYPIELKVSDRFGASARRSFNWTVREQGFRYRREGQDIIFTADNTDDAGTTEYCIRDEGGRPAETDPCWKRSDAGGLTRTYTMVAGEEVKRHYLWTRDATGKMSTTGQGAPFSEALFNAAFKSIRPVIGLNTTLGELAIELEDSAAPLSTANFLNYVEQGFYDGIVFHRIIEGFMVQTGGYVWDANSQYRQKAQGLTPIPLERTRDTALSHIYGTVGMARTNVPDSATTEFFINVEDNYFLDYSVAADGTVNEGYAVFGRVVFGGERGADETKWSTLDKLRRVSVGLNPLTGEESQPTGEPPRIINALRIN
jgi:peptidyl-prolyl cis-trans isomerase A (cyclophilin A)